MEKEDKKFLVLVGAVLLVIAILMLLGMKISSYREEKRFEERAARFEQEIQLKIWYEAEGRVNEIKDIYNYWTSNRTYYDALIQELKEITEFYGLEYPKADYRLDMICNQILVQIENKIIGLWDQL